ncbi:MAG: histidine phosphatase family protein [Rhodospirillaceae bacterium]|nr:histidine phosphatase family protein [Rhodospirillaceae bacterium]MDD9913587.1 histidine phosphatase family protein [Rhodospirillaceae bacterium]MDD9924725.1 histidine phosphatase family protein [Rhodospirillaceae bacterium]
MILIRHGQSEFNVVYGKTRIDPGIRDPKLTELGHRQARAAAETVRELGVHRIVSSPYTRALQTATIIAEALDLSVTVDPHIGERAAFTCDIGTPRSALQTAWPHLQLDHIEETWWPKMEESETALDLRGQAFRTRMHESGDWQGTAVVSHWGFIRTLTGHRVGNCTVLRFDPSAEHPGGGTVVSDTDVC